MVSTDEEVNATSVDDLVLHIAGEATGSDNEVQKEKSDAEAHAIQSLEGECCDSAPVPKPGKHKLRKAHWINLVAYLFSAAVTYSCLSNVYGEAHSVLSAKYMTLATPDGWAIFIWFPIFFLEAAFVVSQMLPRFRTKKAEISDAARWWLGTCACQIAWALTFVESLFFISVAAQVGLIASLTGMCCVMGRILVPRFADFCLLRAPFALHLGWSICDLAVNVNMLIDTMQAEPGVLLGTCMLSFGGVMILLTGTTFGARRSEPLVGAAAAWFFWGVASELESPERLNNPDRFNPHLWDGTTVQAVRLSAIGFGIIAASISGLAAARMFGCRCWRSRRDPE